MLTVTSYFNPMRSRRRLANYRTFRHADHLIQLSGGDIMWQKERLLNIALEAVPDKVEDLAWIDCDLVFESPDWPDAARRALKSDNVIQLFSEAVLGQIEQRQAGV